MVKNCTNACQKDVEMAMKQLSALAMAALGLLAERPMHPYEMYQLLMHRHEDRLVKVRPGTLYHAVGRLADAGLVEATETIKDGNRPERTNYAILPAGRAKLTHDLRELLAVPVNEYPRFPQALSEAHNIPADEVVQLLQSRREALSRELADLASQTKQAQGLEVPRRFWIDAGYQEHQINAELSWLEALCAELQNGALPWPNVPPSTQPSNETLQL